MPQKSGSNNAASAFWYASRTSSPHDSQDLTQGFFLDLLEHGALTRVDRLKGKFRSFLLASFQNHLSVEQRAAHCMKRGGQQRFVHLDAESAEKRYQLEPTDDLSPERIFDARWANALLNHSMGQLADEYHSKGRESLFEALKDFVGIGNDNVEGSYDEAAKALNVGVGTVKTLIHRLRKRYIEIVRQEVARTVSGPAEINSEIHALCDALIAAEGRTGA